MTCSALPHCCWSLYGKTGSNSATQGSRLHKVVISVTWTLSPLCWRFILKLNPIWMCWSFRQPPPLLRRPSPPISLSSAQTQIIMSWGTRLAIKCKFLTPSWEQKEGGHKDCDLKLIRIISSVLLSLLNCLYLWAVTFCTCGFRSTNKVNCSQGLVHVNDIIGIRHIMVSQLPACISCSRTF